MAAIPEDSGRSHAIGIGGAQESGEQLPVGAHPYEMLLETLAGVRLVLTRQAYRIDGQNAQRRRAIAPPLMVRFFRVIGS